MELANNRPQQENENQPDAFNKVLILQKTNHLMAMLEHDLPFFILIDRKTRGIIYEKDVVNVVVDDDMWTVKVKSLECTTLAELHESTIERCTGFRHPEAMKVLNLQYGFQPLSDCYALCMQVIF